MKIKDVLECSFHNWYSKFKRVTPKSIILPVPEGFTQYLIADGIILPRSCSKNISQASEGANIATDDGDDDKSDENWDFSEDAEIEAPEYQEFNQKIEDAIKELGGRVFPKLNWSSPRDASWIGINNSCCCTSVADIYLLLKSSDFIAHDITQPFLLCEDYDSNVAEMSKEELSQTPYYLVLREWVEINPDTEFRCFVKNGELIGITQRDLTIYSDYNVSQEDDIVYDTVCFFLEYVEPLFQSDNYVFDIVRKKRNDVLLLDFNPFGKVTDSLLFDWKELKSFQIDDQGDNIPIYRCINKNMGIQPRPFSYYAIPKDIVDISTGVDTDKFVDLLKLRTENQGNSSDEEQ